MKVFSLMQVLKHEWPARWKSFIPDLVSAAKSSETICENCMAILKVGISPLVAFTLSFYIVPLTKMTKNHISSYSVKKSLISQEAR